MLSSIDISDHYSIFTIIPICKNKSKKNKKNYEMIDMKNFDKEELLITSENKLSDILVNNPLSGNELFHEFVATFADVVNDYAPIRKASRKKTRTKTMDYQQFVKE